MERLHLTTAKLAPMEVCSERGGETGVTPETVPCPR